MPEVTPICQFGAKASDFKLQGTDEKVYRLDHFKGKNGTLIMFICNHCPYVKGVINRLVKDIEKIQKIDIGCVAIMSNNVEQYPEDSFENMKIFATKNNFTFPYLIDDTQKVAKDYGAVCTPDFFGFNNKLELQYRGRLDNSGISGEEFVNDFPGEANRYMRYSHGYEYVIINGSIAYKDNDYTDVKNGKIV